MSKVEKETKFVSQLKRSNSKIRADRAIRIGNKVANSHARMCMDLEEKIASMEDELDAMMDLSTDNQVTSLNVISPKFDANEFVNKVNELKVKIRITKEKLEIAQETSKDWFE